MKATTAQERMDLLDEMDKALRDTNMEWLHRWSADNGRELHARWQTDGTAILEVDGEPVMSVRVEVTTSAVAYEDETNKPTGFVLTRTWGEIPTGWFVKAPGGKWFEVTGTRYEDGKQYVSMEVNGHRAAEWPRDPAEKVAVRKGTMWNERDYALDSLRAAVGPVTVIRDEGQFS